ncbi:MAG: NAD(P)(+) transhydrogenase (Re/Si-specific) subunit beta [Elusimicrobiaceae bacterium]|nr:NAD(P)(+) transhydrogenase (Re/Si-specific) subunit beta [Elusimicrobiaceae bacterium]
MSANISAVLYLASAVCFILALRGLSSPESARRGNMLGIFGMLVAVITTLFHPMVQSYAFIIAAVAAGGLIGASIAVNINMRDLPQLVAAFHSLVGLAAVLCAGASFYAPEAFGILDPETRRIMTNSIVEMSLGVAIGAITFTGSIVAFAKLQGLVSGKPVVFKGQHLLNAVLGLTIIGLVAMLVQQQTPVLFWSVAGLSLLLGLLLIIPIGGADMPVIISMLNSYSGWAAAGIGFTLHNHLLIITGALVGASGAILSYIMCKAMNRPFLSVMLGGFGADAKGAAAGSHGDRAVKSGSAEDAAFLMQNASSVIIVPGYGMAVAQAQHALKEMAELLKKEGVTVRYAIHPVAGRMPGHMNVLLAEANVAYEDVFELDDINSQFPSTDVAFVIGANDVTNPAARTDPSSPIYGMPILDVGSAKTVLFIKRSMNSGYAGIENELFYRGNTMMLFGDAKKVTEAIVKAIH